MRLWIDTDIGTDPDDAVALLCAAAHPDVELVGVSTVDGDTAWRAERAAELVSAPVVGGADLDAAAASTTAPDALLAIGPLTNVAALLDAGYRPPRLAIMGGARRPVEHRGRRQDVEHNFGTDPGAATAVLNRTAALVCPLDVTARMRLDDTETEKLAGLDDRLRPHLEAWQRSQPDTPVCLHDPLALLALLREPCVQVEQATLAVDADGRVRETNAVTQHEVVVDVDVRAAKARVFELLEHGRR